MITKDRSQEENNDDGVGPGDGPETAETTSESDGSEVGFEHRPDYTKGPKRSAFFVLKMTVREFQDDGATDLAAALTYSNVIFSCAILIWVFNSLASVIRGTGNMFVPAAAICASVVLLVPLSPCLIFGLGPFPALGIAGGGVAVVFTTALTAAVLGWYVLSGRSLVRCRLVRPRWALFRDILRVGAVAAVTTLQTTLTVALTTALVGTAAGPEAIAGYGTGGRLEYLLVPLVFGLGAPLVALVGTNIGAGHRARALRIALIGGALAFALTEAVGLAAAVWPAAWLGLFGHDAAMLSLGLVDGPRRFFWN